VTAAPWAARTDDALSRPVPDLVRLPESHPLRGLLAPLPPVEHGPLVPHPARWWSEETLGYHLVPDPAAIGEEDTKAILALTARAHVEELWVLAQTLALHLSRASADAPSVDERRLALELGVELLRAGERLGAFLPEPRAWLAPSRVQRWAAELGRAEARVTVLVVAVGTLAVVVEARAKELARTARSDALRDGLRTLLEAARRVSAYATIATPRARKDADGARGVFAEPEVTDCLGALVPLLVAGPEALPLAVERVLGASARIVEVRRAVWQREPTLVRVEPLVTWLLGLGADVLASRVTGLAEAPPPL
jgi:hypothetical protein